MKQVERTSLRIPFMMLVPLAFLISSCKENSVQPPQNELWIKRGDSTWFYSFSLSPKVIDTVRCDFLETMKIILDGREYTVQKQSGFYTTIHTDPTDITYLSWEGPEGSYVMGEFDAYDTLYTKILTYKYHVRASDSYEFRDIDYAPDLSFIVSDSIFTMQVIAVDTLITTPAGTFKCNQYRYTRRLFADVAEYWQYNLYYAPGIGLIAGHTVGAKSGSVKEDYHLIKRVH